ncbi:DUF1329 domain-containing protein [Oleomonas cavernae]|uniref:DUF1329 domain-containing protein n=1 Tax=Oleomonas cavernae TaxID=2320859 RepID=A0A418WH77_9PROT|nr:DUF1329 domain-containing protein [Oleomonas cavernae]RJF89391.1 DUF1329 domain-containing protein [Oleomonas cavernae]
MNVNKRTIAAVAMLGCLMVSASAVAKITEQEAARLGTDLTPMGAERAGNADGSIPAWDGGIKTVLPGVVPGVSRPDPYAADKPLFKITAANMAQYRAKLTDGQAAMLARYKETFFMNVYPTHRSAALPETIYQHIRAQSTKTELADGGYGLSDLGLSTVPFPIPKTGQEAIWNHLVRYRGQAFERRVIQAVVQRNGSFDPMIYRDMMTFRSGVPETPENADIVLKDVQKILEPQRLAGTTLLAIDRINPVRAPRQAWIYNAGTRRVLRAPEIGYDNPGIAADGARTNDNFDMYNGAIDRYDWKLVGKREMYIPYNANRLDDRLLKYADILKPGHLNPELTRYELHRVWVVEATLKPASRHIYAKRVYYMDEDTWSIVAGDHFDGRGELWRVSEGHLIQYTDATVPLYCVEVLYDLLGDRYIAFGMNNEEPYEINFDWRADDDFYTPSNLRRFAN